MATIQPGKYNPLKPDIELFDFKSKKRYGLKLDGSGALQVGTASQDDTVYIRTTGKRIGDFDEQRSWKGGRGIEELSTNAEGYWDAQNAWTLTSEHAHQTLLWEPARGIRNCYFYLPDRDKSLSWKQLFGATRYMDMSTPAEEAFNADYVRMWVRRVGNPGTLTVELCSDTGGQPDAVFKSVTKSASDAPDVISYFMKFDWDTTKSITLGANYHFKIYGASTDNKTNHWEVGGYEGGTGGLSSADNTTWVSSTFASFFYLADADIKRMFYSFTFDGAFYVVSKNDDGTAGKLWINGDRGELTGVTGASISDSTKNWATNRWAGAYVKIVLGKGAGQVRRIVSNSATQLVVSPNWDNNPNTTSGFIIYGTRYFTEITGHGLTAVTGQPVVANRIVYFPQGTGANLRRMIFNSTTSTHSFADDGTSRVTTMCTSSASDGTVRVWGFTDKAWYASAVAYSTTPSNLTFSSLVVGGESYQVTGAVEKDGTIYVFKENGIWTITSTLAVVRLQSGIEKTPDDTNGAAVIAHQQFVYYSWLHSLIRIYGSSHDDIGQDWSGYGLPDGREGVFRSVDSYTSLLIVGVDAGSGTSSVLGWDGLGWHELVRIFDSNKRCRFVKIQVCPEIRNRMWFDAGGELMFQEMPLMKSSPRLDSGARYMHEAVIESASIDMGTASGLPKFVKELTVYCDNLGNGNEIHIDYQVDDDVHTANWTEATALFQSPEATAFLGLNNIRKFAYRIRINSNDNTKPVDIRGVVPNGYARVPYKMVWTLRCRADNITSRGRLVKPDEMMRWLLDNARFPGRIEMRSQYELAHKFFVIVHPPRMFPYKPAQNGQAEESVFTLVLEEA